MSLTLKIRLPANRRKVEIVEVYDGDELVATIMPGAENDPTLTRSIAIVSRSGRPGSPPDQHRRLVHGDGL